MDPVKGRAVAPFSELGRVVGRSHVLIIQGGLDRAPPPHVIYSRTRQEFVTTKFPARSGVLFGCAPVVCVSFLESQPASVN